jgi:hypothetical protein
MPKSRNRKQHSKKAKARTIKVKIEENKFRKMLFDSFKQKQQEEIQEQFKATEETKNQETETPIDSDFIIE